LGEPPCDPLDRRHLFVPGGIPVTLVIASGLLGVVTWDVDLFATDRNLEFADRTTVGELPPEWRGIARSRRRNTSRPRSTGSLWRRRKLRSWFGTSVGKNGCWDLRRARLG